MIRIGYQNEDKKRIIAEYCSEHKEVKSVIVFSPKRFWLPIEGEQYEYADIIMYKVFYPLLERIDNSFLIVVNECMRTRNRSDLTYNCLHHYLNQTANRIVFEYFPFVEDSDEFMILLDKDQPGRYRGQGFSLTMLDNIDFAVKPHHYTLAVLRANLPEGTKALYEAERDDMFNNLGSKDPDTIPRGLHIWVGQYKRGAIEPDKLYVARNSRYKRPNTVPYKHIVGPGNYIVLDFAHRRMDFNDFLKTSELTTVVFVSTELSVDKAYSDEFVQWIERLEAFYAAASVY